MENSESRSRDTWETRPAETEIFTQDQTPESRLSIIKETNLSVEKEPENVAAESADRPSDEPEMEFEFEERDQMVERIEILSTKLDIHKNGTLFLKELVSTKNVICQDVMLERLPMHQRKPVGDFLLAYLKSTKKVIMTVGNFVANMQKALILNKFDLKSALAREAEPFDDNELSKIIKRVENIGQGEDRRRPAKQNKVAPKFKPNQQPTQRRKTDCGIRSAATSKKPSERKSSTETKSKLVSKVQTQVLSASKPKRSSNERSLWKPKTSTDTGLIAPKPVPKVQYERDPERFDQENFLKYLTPLGSPKVSTVMSSEEGNIIAKQLRMNAFRNWTDKRGSCDAYNVQSKCSERNLKDSLASPPVSHTQNNSLNSSKCLQPPAAQQHTGYSMAINKSYSETRKSKTARSNSVHPTLRGLFNVKTPRILNCILKNGYSFRFEEKKMTRCSSACLHRKNVGSKSFNQIQECNRSKCSDHGEKSTCTVRKSDVNRDCSFRSPGSYSKSISKQRKMYE